MSLGYAFGKLETAVEELVGEGTAKERLEAAFMEACVIDPSDFPTDHLRDEFASIFEAATWLPAAPSEGQGAASFATTFEAMTEDEAAQLNRRLLLLYVDAAAHLYS